MDYMRILLLFLLLAAHPLLACQKHKTVCYIIGDPHSAETEKSFKEQIEYEKSKGWKCVGKAIKSLTPYPTGQTYREYNLCQEMVK